MLIALLYCYIIKFIQHEGHNTASEQDGKCSMKQYFQECGVCQAFSSMTALAGCLMGSNTHWETSQREPHCASCNCIFIVLPETTSVFEKKTQKTQNIIRLV